MCFFTINQNNNGSVGFGILVLKLAIIIGLVVALVHASLTSTEESSFILRILKPIIIDGKKAIYKLLTDKNFYKPFLIATGVATVLVLGAFGMTTLRNYIGPRRQTNRTIEQSTPRDNFVENNLNLTQNLHPASNLNQNSTQLNYPRNPSYPANFQTKNYNSIEIC